MLMTFIVADISVSPCFRDRSSCPWLLSDVSDDIMAQDITESRRCAYGDFIGEVITLRSALKDQIFPLKSSQQLQKQFIKTRAFF